MDWTLTYHLLPLIATLAVSFTLLVIVWRHRTKPGAVSLSVILVGVVGWTAVSIVQIASDDPGVVLAGDLAQIAFIPLTAIGWFAFAAAYTNNRQLLTGPVLGILLGVPALTYLVLLTQAIGVHSLLYATLDARSVTVATGRSLLLPDSTTGPWFVVHAVHGYAFLLAGAYLLVQHAIDTWSVYHRQAVALLIAVAAPLLPNVVRLADLTAIDYTPFGFGVSAVAIAWGLFRYELLDLVPIARDTIIEEMRDAVIVLDHNDRIVDANNAARPIVGTPDDAIGRPAAAVLPFDPASYAADADGGWQELDFDVGDRTVHYRLESTPIDDRSGRRTGTLLVLQDITEMKRRERQLRETSEDLELLNRVVRHDIRNDMNVVAGHAHVLEERIDDETLQEHVEPIRHNSEHAIELTRTVRDLLESVTDESAPDLEPIDLERTITDEIEKARQTYDEATIEFDFPGRGVTVVANSMLSSVFKNLFSNAVRHNDADEPRISVSVSVVDDPGNGETASGERASEERVLVAVEDNGPGIPDDRKEDVFGRGEKGLDSPGTGIGLYLVDTLVTQYGGDVWIEDNDPRGARFVVALPVATE